MPDTPATHDPPLHDCLGGWFSRECFALPAAEYDCVRWRGPNLNGVSLETGWLSTWPKDGPKQLWKASVGAGFSSVSVSQGRVYTMGNNDGTESVSCLESESGKEIWKHSYSSPVDAHYYEGGTSVTPTVDGDAVYTLSKRGQLFCFEAATGKNQMVQEHSAGNRCENPRVGLLPVRP